MSRSALLRLLRNGCNVCELAFAADTSELDMACRVGRLQATVKRRIRKTPQGRRETKLRELQRMFAQRITVPLF